MGNWPDLAGVFFAYDLNKRQIALADRGQGILKTLKRALPNLKNDEEALRAAFTEVVFGRTSENRGNGLKFVREVITKNRMRLVFQTGSASLELGPDNPALVIKSIGSPVRGCLALIKFF